MNDDAWDTWDDARAMLRSRRRRIGDRKLRLLACACARRTGLVEESHRSAVALAERVADGLGSRAELRAMADELELRGWGSVGGDAVAGRIAEATIRDFAYQAAEQAIALIARDGPAIIRDLLGDRSDDPRPRPDERCAVLARAIYDEHRFADLPRLADLIEESGAHDARLLAHLRAPGPHFRGCWALDAVLGLGQGEPVLSEGRWAGETHPFYMLDAWTFLRGAPSPRKRRLLACACCRRVPRITAEALLRGALTAAEAFADGELDATALTAAGRGAEALARARGVLLSSTRGDDPRHAARAVEWLAASSAASLCDPSHQSLGNAMHHAAVDGGHGWDTDDPAQAHLVREVLGSPLRAIVVDPSWARPNVLELAREIYERRAFDRGPALAESLAAAGCDDDALLDHLRQDPAMHVRGCWALDALLGRR